MANILDDNSLADIFGIDIDSNPISNIPVDNSQALTVSNNLPVPVVEETINEGVSGLVKIENSKASNADKQFTNLISETKELMDGAKYLMNATPSPETIEATAKMVEALTTLITEYNRSTHLVKKFELEMEKEKLKSKLRIMEMQAKAEIQKSLQPAIDLGKGNNINIQNNNYVQYRQEDLVKILLNQNKPQEKVIDV